MPKTSPLAASDSLSNQPSSTLDEIQETTFVYETPESSNARNDCHIDNTQKLNDSNKLQKSQSLKDVELLKPQSHFQTQQTLFNIGSSTSQPLISQQLIPNDKRMQKEKNATSLIPEKNCQQVNDPPPLGPLNSNKGENLTFTIIPLEENQHCDPPPMCLGGDIELNENNAFNNALLDVPQNSVTKMPISRNITSIENLQMKNIEESINLHKAPCQHGFGGEII